MEKLIAVKTNDKFYFSENAKRSYSNCDYLSNYLFDGKKPFRSFKENWFYVDKEFKKVEKEIQPPSINHRYELKDPDSFPNLKKVYNKEHVVINEACSDNDWNTEFTEEFANICSLYNLKSDMPEKEKEELEFELEIIGEVEKIDEPMKIKNRIYKDEYFTHKGGQVIQGNFLKKRLYDEMSTPGILLHEKPAYITSKKFYDIIRYHVGQNIDSRYARITSDYNFCFMVMKKIKTYERWEYVIDINFNPFSRIKKRPKHDTRYKDNREVKVFSMTHEESNYEGYEPIKGIGAENDTKLKEKIDKYLDELMEEINRPLEDCPHCKGAGCVLKNKEK
jgi:hypothetical protein